MMQHQTLTSDRWSKLSLAMQLMNISSELARVQSFIRKNDLVHRDAAWARAFELLDLSVAVSSTPARRRELARLRELLRGVSIDDSSLPITLADIQAEVEPFAMVCARERGGLC